MSPSAFDLPKAPGTTAAAAAAGGFAPPAGGAPYEGEPHPTSCVTTKMQTWEVSSSRDVVCAIMERQRAGRADRALGCYRAGEGVAWRHILTGRVISSTCSAALHARFRYLQCENGGQTPS